MKASRIVIFILPLMFIVSDPEALDDAVLKWLSDNSDDPAYSIQLEYLLSTVKNSKELNLVTEQYIPFVSDLEERALLFFHSALLFELWGNLHLAIASYRMAYAVNPQPNYAYREALMLYETGQYKDSRRLLLLISKYADKLEGYDLLLSRLDNKEQGTAKSLELAKKLADADDASAADMYYYYSLLFQSGKTEESRLYQKKLNEKYPESPEAAIVRHVSGSSQDEQIREFPSLSRLLPIGGETVLLDIPLDQETDLPSNTKQNARNQDEKTQEEKATKASDSDRALLGLQVASFTNKNNAEALLQKLIDKGLPAKSYIMEINTDTGHYYRVIISYDPNAFADSNTFFTALLEYNIEGILLYD